MSWVKDKVLKDLIETNIRQRGIGNPNPIKLGRCIKELERIYTIQNGGDRKSEPKLSELKDENDIHTQKQLAEMIGISVDTLNNYKKLTELVPELQDWVETGILAPTTAIVSNLQEKLKVLVTANFQRPKNSESNSMKKLLDTGEIIYCVEG